MSDFEHLASIGFTVITGENGKAEITFADGTKAPDHAHERLRHLSGRLDNIRYMARAMDHYDGVEEPAKGTIHGDQQFEHLLTRHQPAALIYFALRRLQRAGEFAKLRQGLTILLAYDHGELSAADAVLALWPKGSEIPSALPALPNSIPTLIAA